MGMLQENDLRTSSKIWEGPKIYFSYFLERKEKKGNGKTLKM